MFAPELPLDGNLTNSISESAKLCLFAPSQRSSLQAVCDDSKKHGMHLISGAQKAATIATKAHNPDHGRSSIVTMCSGPPDH